MIGILSATIVFSFFSMFHCAAMCGPLKFSLVKTRTGTWLYHIGRAIAYLSLAVLMHLGALSTLSKFQQENSWLFFLIISLIIFGVVIILAKKYYLKTNAFLSSRFINLIHSFESKKAKAFSIGLLTGLLPCGVLYAFLLSMAMIEQLEVLLLGVIVFVVITGFGVNASSLILVSISSKFRINKRIFTIVMVIVSYGLLLNRFVGDQIMGICFS